MCLQPSEIEAGATAAVEDAQPGAPTHRARHQRLHHPAESAKPEVRGLGPLRQRKEAIHQRLARFFVRFGAGVAFGTTGFAPLRTFAGVALRETGSGASCNGGTGSAIGVTRPPP